MPLSKSTYFRITRYFGKEHQYYCVGGWCFQPVINENSGVLFAKSRRYTKVCLYWARQHADKHLKHEPKGSTKPTLELINKLPLS